ncbi:efflux RND transporter periplasmic adaptor subunit [Thalassotalea mangrovi]|uniref:Efflux RND transporter periplasmic adaptor subunit n=1 Tax=Thalassotalea mangrovi TaxID=2572245 RepID=A0A4U1B6A3_9GAMM|nr:efflux RND transporter periplasmic adaptor subunit [Thalassotalea mangrovi]TKB46025.1 efflux RND transporter periplasmic adaptor subunit [Thalassotalea mangrovi]
MKIADTSNQDVVIKKKSKFNQWAVIAGICLITLSLAAWQIVPAASNWSQADISIPQKRVRIGEITVGDFTRDVSVQGRVVAAVSPTIYAPAEGTITFSVDAGTKVSKQQLLASIDSPELTARFEQEAAGLLDLQTGLERQRILAKKQFLIDKKAVDLAKVALTTAEREKRRADLGYEKSAISQIDFEKAQDDLANAKLQYEHAVDDARLAKESAEFEIKSLELQIKRQTSLVNELQRQVDALQVRSPVNGIVGNLNVENKTYLAKNQPILMVVDLTQFEVEVAIPESYADDLAIGMDVDIKFNRNQYAAQLITISPEIIENQVTGRVRFKEKSPAGLRQNQRLNSRILLEQRTQVLQVPRGQFLDSSNGKFAYVLNGDIAEKKAILTGARSLGSVEILDGLQAGDRIIISGTDRFKNANKVLLTQ